MDRVKGIREALKKQKLDAVLISSVSNIIYLTNFTNFSKEEREAYLIITQKGQYIITDPRYSEAVGEQVPDFTLLETSHSNPFKKLIEDLVKKEQLKVVGFEEMDLRVGEFNKLFKLFSKLIPFEFPPHRTIKTPDEIELIKRACEVGDKAFDFILKKLKLGVSEKEIGFLLESFFGKVGEGSSFPPIVAFGSHSSIPHHQTGDKKLSTDTFILLDFGVKFKSYCSDMTRTIFFGKITDKHKKIYNTVLESQASAAKYIQECLDKDIKIKASEVGKGADGWIRKKGYPSIPHGLGHGIGIEVHEHPHISPGSKDILVSGMVFSIEPGIYIPGFGGVRIEDLYWINGTKLVQLTSAPKNLINL
jgi:Xaa-Pro aminopeptidase